MENICDGVKILCERMETNPEDFEHGGKFYYYGQEIDQYLVDGETRKHRMGIFNREELDMLTGSYKNMAKARYTRSVIETLVEAPAEVEQPKPSKRGGPLTTKAIRESLKEDLNKAFATEYDTYSDTFKYKAVGRYDLPDPWKL